MKDLYHAIDALNDILNEAPPQGRQDGPGTRQGTAPKPKPAGPAAYNSIGDMVKAIKTPGRQGVADPNQSAKNIAAAQPKPAAKPKLGGTGVGRQDGPGLPKPAAPKINPAVPAAGPVRANPINPQAMAATKAAASVVNAPKQAAQAPKPAAVAVPKPKPAAPAPRAKVKATAANTKDFDKTMALQKKLQAQGYDIKADGLMGPNTRAAMAKAAAAKKPATPPSKVTPTAGDPGMQAAQAPQANRAQSQGGRTAQQAASAPQAPPQDAQAARVAKSNAALAGDAEKAKKATSGMIDKITGGISDLFKPSPNSAIGKRQAAAMDEPGDAMAAAVTGSTQSGVSAKPGPSLSDVTAAGNARFGDPLQKARDARDAQQQTTPLKGSGNQIPANVQSQIDARRADVANRYDADADGNYSLANPPRQPSDAAPTTRTAAATGAAPTGRTDTSFRASDGTNTVARDASGNLNVKQRVTDPEAKSALMQRIDRARRQQRLALAAGSTDPDDIRAYQRRMANTQGTGAAGGTDPNTF